MNDKFDWEKQLKSQMDEWKANFETLCTKAQEMQAEGQEKLGEQIEAMRKQRDEMEQKMEEARSTQMENWTEMKARADKAWDDMAKAMQDAWKKFT